MASDGLGASLLSDQFCGRVDAESFFSFLFLREDFFLTERRSC